jgi:hypothetical protein
MKPITVTSTSSGIIPTLLPQWIPLSVLSLILSSPKRISIPTESHPGLSRSSGTGQLLLVLRSRAIQDQLKNVNIPGLQVRPIRAKAIEYTWSYKNRDTVIPALQQFLSQFPDQ